MIGHYVWKGGKVVLFGGVELLQTLLTVFFRLSCMTESRFQFQTAGVWMAKER